VEGPALEFDFPSLHIGIAEYDEGPTGVTVFYFPKKVFAAVDVRGGAPGTIETDGIRVGYSEKVGPGYDAICLTGGSSLGLESATGVMAELLAKRGNSAKIGDIPGVSGAVVYDFNNRNNAIHPDKELGRAAFKAAKPGRFLLGARGAGRFVHVGGYFGVPYGERSGQGGAFRQVGETRIAVFTVVNALGAVIDRKGQVVRGNRDLKTGKRTHIGDDLKNGTKSKPPAELPGSSQRPKQNTTISLVVTNQKLSYAELDRLAIQTHAALNRVIQPFHTVDDGDTLFAVTTAEVKNDSLSLRDLSTHAAELAWDAVLSSQQK
jgi:L-aminopeptidase/D-esterase-like protein